MRHLAVVMLSILLGACVIGPSSTTPASPSAPTRPPVTPLPASPVLPTRPPATLLADGLVVVFYRQGGFAYNEQTLTVRSDGTAALEVHYGPAAAGGTFEVPPEEFEALTALLDDPGWAAVSLEPNRNVMCNDCYEYRLEALTSQGLVKIQVDDADLMEPNNPPQVLRQTVDLLNRWMTSRG